MKYFFLISPLSLSVIYTLKYVSGLSSLLLSPWLAATVTVFFVGMTQAVKLSGSEELVKFITRL